MIALDSLQSAWQLAPILSTRTPDTGTIHQTLLLKTETDEYALRAYRYHADQRKRIEYEHALAAYVYTHGLPAIVPLSLPAGETILEHEGRFYALFPFARGYQLQREELTIREAAAMGTLLAQLHSVLCAYPHECVPSRAFEIDTAATLARIEHVLAIIRARETLDSLDSQSLIRLEQRRTWLTQTQPIDMQALSQIEHQVIHGDYQETNVFFEESNVSAIIDWDQSYVAPRAWEVVRTIHYAFKFKMEFCRSFLDAYARVFPLPPDDLEVAAQTYGWMRAHDMWLYEELYLHDNSRVRRFMGPGNFTPFAEQWSKLQAALHL